MWTIVVTIKDSKGATSKLEIHFPGATLLGSIITFLGTFLADLDVIIGGVITGMSANFQMAPTGTKTSPTDVNQDVEEGALFVFNSVGGYQTRFRVPTFLESKLLAGTRQVNTADTAVATFISDIVTGIGGTLPSDVRGADIVSLSSAKEMFQKSRRV